MGAIASQITSLTFVYSTVYSHTDQRKHQSSASLAFVRGNSPHKWPVTRKMFPFDDVIMQWDIWYILFVLFWCDGTFQGSTSRKVTFCSRPFCFSVIREMDFSVMKIPDNANLVLVWPAIDDQNALGERCIKCWVSYSLCILFLSRLPAMNADEAHPEATAHTLPDNPE